MNDYRANVNELFEKHFERLFTHCLLALNSDRQDAADVVGDVFIAAEKNAEKLYSHPDAVGWLYKTANHLIAKKHRNRSRHSKRNVSFETLFTELENRRFDFSFDDYESVFEKKDFSDEEIERIKGEILSELNHGEYELYKAVFVETKSYSEIAEEYGTSQDAVRMRIHRLKMKLHRLVQKRFY